MKPSRKKQIQSKSQVGNFINKIFGANTPINRKKNTRQHPWVHEHKIKRTPSSEYFQQAFTNHWKKIPKLNTPPFAKKFISLIIKVASRELVVQVIFISLFVIIIHHFATLQVFGKNPVTNSQQKVATNYFQLISSKRGQIFIQDLSQNQINEKRYVPVTQTVNSANLVYNPKKLSKVLRDGENLPNIVNIISSNLNLPYNQVKTQIEEDLEKDQVAEYSVLKKSITQEQKDVLEKLGDDATKDKILTSVDLHLEEKDIRIYSENKLLASTIGYVPKSPVIREDAINTNCKQTVLENEKRGTFRSFDGTVENTEYQVGYYGLEQKYCDILSGLNGKRYPGTGDNNQNLDVVHGANIFTTIDKNLQQKAEQVLEETMKRNTNENGAPRDGTIIVMQAKTGKILAMSSSPTFDPNK